MRTYHYTKAHRSRFLTLVTTVGVLTLVTMVTIVCQVPRQSMSVSLGKWLLGGHSAEETLCLSQKEVMVSQKEVPHPQPMLVAKPLMVRHPKGKDLEPKPFEFPGMSTQTELKLARRSPHCLLLGFAKCGTSALLEFMSLHHKIVTVDWESDYFCDRMYAKYDLQWYVKRMPPSYPDQVTIEKSPCYIVEHDAHIRMHAMNASLKVMVLVRNPIVRLLSEYGHYSATERYWGRVPTPFIDRISDGKTGQLRTAQLLKVGNYLPHFEHLFEIFPRNQILVLDGDKLITDPLMEIAKVESFLGLYHEISARDIYFDEAKGFYCSLVRDTGERKCLGQSKGREHENLDDDLKMRLNEYFRPYNEKLFELLDQDFGWINENFSLD